MTGKLTTFRNVTLIIVIALWLLVTCAPAVNVLSPQPSSVSVQPGTISAVDITADALPNGLSGYDLEVNLTGPAAAKIVNVTFPTWEIISNTTQLSPSSVRISGVDINQVIQPGTTNLLLATITLEGITSGTTAVKLSNVHMDDKNGTDLNPPTLTNVPTASNTGTNGGGSYYPSGGDNTGSSGGYSSSVAVGGGAPTTASVTAATTKPVVSISSDIKQDNTNPAPITTPAIDQPVQSAAIKTDPVTSSSSGSPSIVPGGMVMFAVIIAVLAACGLLYFTHKKKL